MNNSVQKKREITRKRDGEGVSPLSLLLNKNNK